MHEVAGEHGVQGVNDEARLIFKPMSHQQLADGHQSSSGPIGL